MKLSLKEHVCVIYVETILRAIKSILYIMVMNHFLGANYSESVPVYLKQLQSLEIIKLKIEKLPLQILP